MQRNAKARGRARGRGGGARGNGRGSTDDRSGSTGPATGLCLAAGTWATTNRTHALQPHEACPRVLSAYSDLNTPALRAEKLCCSRPEQLEQLAALRHETCDGVELRLTDALEALRDTRVVFLGDSLMQNVFEALTTALHREGHAFRARRWNPERQLGREHYDESGGVCALRNSGRAPVGGSIVDLEFSRPARGAARCRVLGVNASSRALRYQNACDNAPASALHVPLTRTTFTMHRLNGNFSRDATSPAVRRGAMEKELARCIAPAHSFDGRIAAASADADLVIANLGAWYNNVPSKDAKDGSGAMSGEALAARYEDDLGHLLRRLRAHERRVEEGRPPPRVLLMESVVQHFPESGGTGLWDAARKYKRCHRQCAPLGDEQALDWRNAALHRVAAREGFDVPSQVVPLASLLRPLHGLHHNLKGCGPDCTHYCYSPVLWSALLDGVYRRIVNGARGRGAGLPSYLV